ncbi:2984_t:CDS:2 [Entrophospora sp. SA101]|nr:2984_t:CDS:2 [Entrophospora sp. SA101]
MSVFKGKKFELEIKNLLNKYRINLVRTESSGDGGVDLLGAFVHEDEKYVLVVQCKHAKSFPHVVRDLRGVMAIYPDYTSIGILVINSEHDISNRMREEARLASSNIIVSDEISIYDDLTLFLVYLKQQKALRHLREKEALRKEIGEDMEKELSKKMMDEGIEERDRRRHGERIVEENDG